MLNLHGMASFLERLTGLAYEGTYSSVFAGVLQHHQGAAKLANYGPGHVPSRTRHKPGPGSPAPHIRSATREEPAAVGFPIWGCCGLELQQCCGAGENLRRQCAGHQTAGRTDSGRVLHTRGDCCASTPLASMQFDGRYCCLTVHCQSNMGVASQAGSHLFSYVLYMSQQPSVFHWVNLYPMEHTTNQESA